MDLSFTRGQPRATIFNSGRLNFNAKAVSMMGLEGQPSYKLAIEGEYSNQSNLYLLETDPDDSADNLVRIAKTGRSHHLSLKQVFDRWGIDYENRKFRYKISRSELNGQALWVLSPVKGKKP